MDAHSHSHLQSQAQPKSHLSLPIPPPTLEDASPDLQLDDSGPNATSLSPKAHNVNWRDISLAPASAIAVVTSSPLPSSSSNSTAINLKENVNVPKAPDACARLNPGLVFRSGMFYNGDDINDHKVKTIIDLRRETAKPVVDRRDQNSQNGVNLFRIPLVSKAAGRKTFSQMSFWKKLYLVMNCFKTSVAESLLVDFVMRDGDSLGTFYIDIVENGAAELKRVFDVFGERNNYPLLVHCVAGKDRTGIVVALLYALLGVEDNVTVADYAMSGDVLINGLINSGSNSEKGKGKKKGHGHVLLTADSMKSPPRAMVLLLERLNSKYGSVEKFLVEYCGVDTGTINNIREILLKPQV